MAPPVTCEGTCTVTCGGTCTVTCGGTSIVTSTETCSSPTCDFVTLGITDCECVLCDLLVLIFDV